MMAPHSELETYALQSSDRGYWLIEKVLCRTMGNMTYYGTEFGKNCPRSESYASHYEGQIRYLSP